MRAYSGCLFGSIKIIQRSLIIPCFPILEDTSGLLHTFLSTLCTESVILPPPQKNPQVPFKVVGRYHNLGPKGSLCYWVGHCF